MSGRRTLCASINRICEYVLLVPFLLMALLPAAVMPTRGADGAFMLVLCTGDGPVQVAADRGGDTGDTAARDRCDWAAHTDATTMVDSAVPLRSAAFARQKAVLAADLVAPAHDPHGVMARGPPAAL